MADVTRIIRYPSSLPTLKVCIHHTVETYVIKEVYPDSRPLLGGHEGPLLHLIADALGVALEYYVNADAYPSYWSKNISDLGGCVGLVARHEVDFTISAQPLYLEESLQVVTGTRPYSYVSVRFVTKMPNLVQKPFVFMEPFTLSTWILIFFTLLAISFVYFWIQEKDFSFTTQLFSRFAELVTQSPVETYRIKSIITVPERLLAGFWGAGSYFLALFYIAVILNFMIAPRREPPITTNEEVLIAVKKGHYKAGVVRGTPYLIGMKLSRNENLQELATIIAENRWIFHFNKERFLTLLEDNYAIATDSIILPQMHQPGYPINVLDDEMFGVYLIGCMTNNFTLKDKMNNVIARIVEAGLQDKIYKDYYDELHLKDEGNVFEEELIKPLALKDFQGVFLLYGIGMSVSAAVLIAEIIKDKIGKRNKRQSCASISRGTDESVVEDCSNLDDGEVIMVQ